MESRHTVIDFQKIRGTNVEGQRASFEELVCQLARRTPPEDALEFRRVHGAGGDGGVEAYWLCRDGSKTGFQAKFHLKSAEIDWNKIGASVRQALDNHPELRRYVVAMPCDLTDATGRKGKTGSQAWAEHKAEWEGWANDRGGAVEFELWGQSELLDALAATELSGLVRYWFDRLRFDASWFSRQLARAVDDLDERYHPDDHVDVVATDTLDGLIRGSVLRERLAQAITRFLEIDGLSDALKRHGHPLNDGQVSTLDGITSVIRRAAESLAFPRWQVWPTAEWLAATRRCLDVLSDLQNWIWLQEPKRAAEDLGSLRTHNSWISAREASDRAWEAADGLHALLESSIVQADASRFIYAVGPAGAGKSHLLAHWAKRQIVRSRPVILLLGTQFDQRDPWQQVKERLDVTGWTTDELLDALDAAAEAAATRCVIIVDGINEAAGARLWISRAPSFLEDVRKRSNLALVFSCRSEYRDSVIPGSVVERATRLWVHGFTTYRERERAAQVYMERWGIARPAMPRLTEEFTNPLLLRTCCEALRKRNENTWPQGAQGASRLLRLYVESLANGLDHPSPPDDRLAKPLIGAFDALAASMARAGCDYVRRPDADRIISGEFAAYGGPAHHRTWMDAMLRAGALRSDPDPERLGDDVVADDVVRIAFQRFADLLIANVLITSARDTAGLARSFAPGGALEPLLRPDGYLRGAPGVLAALAILVPERLGRELVDLLSGGEARWWRDWAVQEAFTQSVISRAETAWSERARVLFNSLSQGISSAPPQLRVLAQVAVIEGHPLNADALHQRLIAIPLPDRDAFWTVGLSHIGRGFDPVDDEAKEETDPHPVHELIEWAWHAPKQALPDEALRLASVFLCWCLTAAHRAVRDRATRALGAILLDRPLLFPPLLAQFSRVDDPYVIERLLAAAYGIACAGLERAVAVDYAQAIDEHLIDAGRFPRHLLTRDFARGIVEAASRLANAQVEAVLARIRPPYRSSWPLEIPSDDALQALVDTTGATAIHRSVLGLIGDFGRYEVEPDLRSFTATPLSDPAPATTEEMRRTYEREVVATWHPSRQALYQTILKWDDRPFTILLRISVVERPHVEEQDAVRREAEELTRRIKRRWSNTRKLLASMTTEERAVFRKRAAPDLFAQTSEGRQIKRIAPDDAKRWIVRRAIDMGWTNDRFPHDGSSFVQDHHGRSRPPTERIGKKYQWIALDELRAILADNVWLRAEWSGPSVRYDHPCQINIAVRDFDPSLFATTRRRGGDNHAVAESQWFANAMPMPTSEDIAEWPFKATTLWRGEVPLLHSDSSGTRWAVLHGWGNVNSRDLHGRVAHEQPRTQAFMHVSAILMDADEQELAWQRLKGRRLTDWSEWSPRCATDGPFLLEARWRNTWDQHDGWDEFRASDHVPLFKWRRPVVDFLWERHLDASLEDGFGRTLPARWVMEALDLKADPRRPGFYNDCNGAVAYRHAGAAHGTIPPAVIRFDLLETLLQQTSLGCLWIVAGEMNAWPSGGMDHYGCRYHSSIHRSAAGRLVNESWFEDLRRFGKQTNAL